MSRTPYYSDVSDGEWAFVVPYLTVMKEDAPQREYALRQVFNGLRYIARTGMRWRMMPNDLPPWHTVYQQMQRWLPAGVFDAMVRDLCMLLREIAGRPPRPRAAILDGCTLQSSPESGVPAGYDGHKRRKESEVVKLPTAKRGFSVIGRVGSERAQACAECQSGELPCVAACTPGAILLG